LAAVLAADIAGYSRLMGADEVGALAAQGEPDRVFAPGRQGFCVRDRSTPPGKKIAAVVRG